MLGISFLDPQVLTVTLMLTGALLLGAIVIAAVDRWRKRQANRFLATHDHLASFRILYEQGELSREEYDRIRGKLSREGKIPKSAEKVTPPTPDTARPGDPGTIETVEPPSTAIKEEKPPARE